MELTDQPARKLGAILGGAFFKPAVVEELEAVFGNLLIDWVTLGPASPGAGKTIGELQIRRRTGVTVVAIVRDNQAITVPEPSETLHAATASSSSPGIRTAVRSTRWWWTDRAKVPLLTGGTGWSDALVQFLGGGREFRYGRTTMGVDRRPHLTTAFVVVAVLLGSLWAGGLAVPAAGGPAGQLTAGASLPGIEPAALPDRVPALRPSTERPGPDGRLLPLLLGLLTASLG